MNNKGICPLVDAGVGFNIDWFKVEMVKETVKIFERLWENVHNFSFLHINRVNILFECIISILPHWMKVTRRLQLPECC